MNVPYRPLGIIVGIIERLGLEVTYAYEDLVFISHNAFLLRMGAEGHLVHVYFNIDSETDKRPEMLQQLSAAATQEGLTVLESGTYAMEPREDEQLDIHFYEVKSDGVET